MENKPQATGYLLVEKTFKEVEEAVDGLNNYDRKTMFEHKRDLGDISDRQKEIQDGNSWWVADHTDMRLGEDTLCDYVKKVMYDKLSSGVRENLTAEVFNTVMNSKVKTVAELVNVKSGYPSITTQTYIEDEKDKDYARITTDIKEFEDAMSQVKNRTYAMRDNEDEYILLERVEIQAYAYFWQKITQMVKKYIKRVVREDLTYCLKKDKVIIPEEYLSKGKDGIEEWRTIKSGKNKNNSMEKRMLKQVFADKKERAYKMSALVMDQLTKGNRDWSVPQIQIDGRWNRGRMAKFVTNTLSTTDKQKFLNMSDDDMIREFKNYWQNKLMEIYNDIDKLDVVEEIEKRGY